MKQVLRVVRRLLGLALLLGAGGAVFFYKIRHGFPVSYETEQPAIHFPEGKPALLLFSKTTAYRHGASIRASKLVFKEMARRYGWFIYETEEGGVFNPEQLRQFKVVIFNNSTGRVLTKEQQEALSRYIEAGGTLLGIHGAGDNSHHWPWYEASLLGTQFSHHPVIPHLQTTVVQVDARADSSLTQGLPPTWAHEDEWYVFFDQPKEAQVVTYINGEKIITNGNMLWITNKNFGMGKYHPTTWYRSVGLGKTFYTSMGHSATVWQDAHFVRLIENAIRWSLR